MLELGGRVQIIKGPVLQLSASAAGGRLALTEASRWSELGSRTERCRLVSCLCCRVKGKKPHKLAIDGLLRLPSVPTKVNLKFNSGGKG